MNLFLIYNTFHRAQYQYIHHADDINAIIRHHIKQYLIFSEMKTSKD